MKKPFDFNKYYGTMTIILAVATLFSMLNLILKIRYFILIPLIAFVLANFITMQVIKKNQDQIIERSNKNEPPPYKKTFISYAISLVSAFAMFLVTAIAIQ
ncbi:MAG: hypothetical protein RSA99_05100 [Oscillospiraceae bacterium]